MAAKAADIDARLSSLRDDLDTLQKNVRGLATDVSGVASVKANEALRNAEALAERAYKLAEETASQASAKAFETAGDIEEWTTENAETVREMVREQPLTSIGIAVGIGAFLALLLKR